MDSFLTGDLVWLHSPVVPRGQSKKLHQPWTGPYKIVTKLSDKVCLQLTQYRRKRPVVHFDRLKPCSRDTRFPDSQIESSTQMPEPSEDSPVGTGLEPIDNDPDDMYVPETGVAQDSLGRTPTDAATAESPVHYPDTPTPTTSPSRTVEQSPAPSSSTQDTVLQPSVPHSQDTHNGTGQRLFVCMLLLVIEFWDEFLQEGELW